MALDDYNIGYNEEVDYSVDPLEHVEILLDYLPCERFYQVEDPNLYHAASMEDPTGGVNHSSSS